MLGGVSSRGARTGPSPSSVALRLAAALLAAAPPLARAAAPPTPFSLTVSGGVSLGAYEAGLLHYTLAWLEANGRRSELRLATGSSAGSVNAVLSVLAHCGEGSPAPTESLFYRTWVPLGLSDLYVEPDVTALSALSRRWMEKTAAEVEERWLAGLAASCDVVLGISATRVVPRSIELGGALEIPRVEERFALRIEGRGPGRPPRLTNYVGADGGDALLLPEGPDGEVAFSALRDLLFASSAVPLAFAPVELAYCAPSRGTGPPHCPRQAAERAFFIDGGVFDNTPLRLAVRLARAGLRGAPGERARWLPRSQASPQGPLPDVRFVFVSPDVTSYPSHEAAFELDRRTTLARLLGQEAEAFLVTARAKNLYTLVEESPEIVDQVVVPARNYPAASSPMAAFFGFFEREFRRFDFYLGMYDARRIIAERVVPSVNSGGEGGFLFPEDAPGASAQAFSPLRCLRAAFDDPAAAARACAGEDLVDFRILAQTSLERLYEGCRTASSEAVERTSPSCRRAHAGEKPPELPGVATVAGADFHQGHGEGEPAYVVRLLANHRFRFRDLGLERDEAPDALRRVRLRLGSVVAAIAAAQPASDGIALDRIGQVAANALVYVPSRNVSWIAFSRDVEVGYGHGLPNLAGFAGTLQLQLALQTYGLYDLLSSERKPWGLAPLVGLGSLVPGLSNATFQHGLVLRAGWLFASGDAMGTRACTDPGNGTLGSCSRFTAQAGVYSVALEILRLQLLFEWFPALRAGQGSTWSLSPALGVQFVF